MTIQLDPEEHQWLGLPDNRPIPLSEAIFRYGVVIAAWEANKRLYDAQEARLRTRLAELRRMEEKAA